MELADGDFTLVDSTRPFGLVFGRRFEQLSFTIPHEALVPLIGDPAAVTARRVRGDRGLGVLLQLARDEVERSLHDTTLTPADVALRVGVSTRYLHRLFSADGLSFGRWLLGRRLTRCHEALTDPARAHWTVTQIAFEHGFADPSYFARAFKTRYGMTPRAWRARMG